MATEIETALSTYLATKQLAEATLDGIDRRVYAGKESQKREAQGNLSRDRNIYSGKVLNAAFGISVCGVGSEDFAKKAVEEGAAIVIDATAIYKQIADRVRPSIGTSGLFGTNQFGLVINELRDIMATLGFTSIDAPKWTEPANVRDDKELLAHVAKLVNDSAGVSIVGPFIANQIVAQALRSEEVRSTVPVVVLNVEPSLNQDLLAAVFAKGRSMTWTTTSPVVKSEEVIEVFNNVKKQLKTQKKSSN